MFTKAELKVLAQLLETAPEGPFYKLNGDGDKTPDYLMLPLNHENSALATTIVLADESGDCVVHAGKSGININKLDLAKYFGARCKALAESAGVR